MQNIWGEYMEDIKYYLEIAKEETKLAFSNNKTLLFISILLFVIPMLIGYFCANEISEYVKPIVDAFEQQVKDGTVTLTTHSLFTNNVTVAFILYALAALGGVLGAIILANNGLFIGYYGVNFDIWAYLALTLPHGIFLQTRRLVLRHRCGCVYDGQDRYATTCRHLRVHSRTSQQSGGLFGQSIRLL